jgi:hypothetical protein
MLVMNQYLDTDMGYSRPLIYSPEEVSVQVFPDSELQILTIMLTIYSKAVGSGFETLILYVCTYVHLLYAFRRSIIWVRAFLYSMIQA